MVVGGARDEHAARLAKLLQPRRNVDAVAEEVVAFDHHVAQIDANAEDDTARLRHIALPLGNRLLHRYRSGHRIDDRGKLDDRTIAHQLDDTAFVLSDNRIDGYFPQRLDGGKRRCFISLDQARIADDVRGQNR